MASVKLTQLWVNDALDPLDYLTFRYATLNDVPSTSVEVRRYAGGTARAIRRPGVARTVNATILRIGPSERDWLIEHLGRVVAVRDGYGRRVFGVYQQIPLDDVPALGYSTATLQVEQVSWNYGEA